MSNDKKPKSGSEFFSESGEEFIKEKPAKGWELPPPELPPEPPPPPPKLRIHGELVHFFFELFTHLRIRAFARDKYRNGYYPQSMWCGFDPMKVDMALKAIGLDFSVIPENVYTNAHMSGRLRLITELGKGVVAIEIDELVDNLVSPQLSLESRTVAVTLFKRVAIGIMHGHLAEKNLKDPRLPIVASVVPRNPWGDEDD